MKVLFRIRGKVEIINNVSVDDKCFPLVGGIHPYSASSKSKSPLALESSLWFKTLAVDAVYVDCDSSLIFWSEIKNESISEHVKLRKKESIIHYDYGFVPENARPLVSDTALFDFDPSYKEMIVKSIEVAKKLSHKSVSVNDANSMVANLLHVYILPSINFTKADYYALSRARCLIEERHLKADDDIASKAKAINLLQTSLENLKDNLLLKDNCESENYLQTCNMKFLKVFLKKIEEDSLKLNLDLEAQQSKVNWAKEQKYEKEEIAEFQRSRDALFKEVEKLIKVREALKNVVTRKAKVKRKSQARQQIIDSCFHNVFLEILRRLEVENKIIEQLVEDKLNISAAREAIMSVILDLNEEHRIPSDRSTKFEPSTFGDYHPDGKVQVEKSDAWLTLQERVSRLFRDKSSQVSLIHMAGCKNLNLQIDAALSEFHLRNKRRIEDEENRIQVREEPGSPLPTDDSGGVVAPAMPDAHEEQTGVSAKETGQDNNGVVNHKPVTSEPVSRDNEITLRHSLHAPSPGNASRRSGLVIGKGADATNLMVTEEDGLACTWEIREIEGMDNYDKANSEDLENQGFVVIDDIGLEETLESPEEQKERKNFFISENLAINMLMAAVEKVKAGIHEHFKEVVQCLQEHLNPGSVDPFEILWKAYERHFSEEVLQSLTTLYHAMLQPGSSDVYREIQSTSMQDLLEGDKILNLFFLPSSHATSSDGKTQPIDTISMAKTFSNMSLDVRQYSVNELYSLANADSSDLCRRFQLDTDDHSQEVMDGSASSSESGASVKTADLFDDEDEGISHSNVSSSDSSRPEYSKADSLDRNQTPLRQNEETKENQAESEVKSTSSAIGSDTPSESSEFLSPHDIISVMDPVLSPFRKQIVKCMNARSVLDKMRYLSKGVQRLNDDISLLYGPDHISACDDIISMLVLSLANMSEDIYVGLYSNLRLLIDILPSFLSGTLCDYNLICLCAAYDYMLNRNVCQRVVKRYGASFKVKLTQS